MFLLLPKHGFFYRLSRSHTRTAECCSDGFVIERSGGEHLLRLREIGQEDDVLDNADDSADELEDAGNCRSKEGDDRSKNSDAVDASDQHEDLAALGADSAVVELIREVLDSLDDVEGHAQRSNARDDVEDGLDGVVVDEAADEGSNNTDKNEDHSGLESRLVNLGLVDTDQLEDKSDDQQDGSADAEDGKDTETGKTGSGSSVGAVVSRSSGSSQNDAADRSDHG